MIQTWIADVTPLLEKEIYEKFYAVLPEWRKEKADRMRHREDRARSVGAWSLYQRMREACGISGEPVYNLSHSGRYALCSVEDDGRSRNLRLGCDVEMIREFRPGIAKRFFCPAEEAWILGQTSRERQAEEFYRYWVLKESFIKAVRQGLKLDLRSFEICVSGAVPYLVRQPEEYPENYYYREYRVEAGDARIAVCSTSPEFGELRKVDMS